MSYLVALQIIILLAITGCFSTKESVIAHTELSSDSKELSSDEISSAIDDESSEDLSSNTLLPLSHESESSSEFSSSVYSTISSHESSVVTDFSSAIEQGSSSIEQVSSSRSDVDTVERVCDDMIDNDADGLMDCYDPDCHEGPVCSINPETYLYHIDYEDGLLKSETLGLGHDTTKEYSATIDETIVRSGKYSARFELRSSDNLAFNGTRSENDALDVEGAMFTEGDSLYYRMSVYIPEGWVDDGANEDILYQWKMTGVGGGPHIFFGIKRKEFILRHSYDGFKGQETVTSLVEGVWNDFIFNIVWSSAPDGSFAVWHKLQTETKYTQVLEKLDIPTLFSLASERKNYIKWGLYCPKWNAKETTADKRVVYFDNITIGKDMDFVQ
ncbi:MAG: heparin lyase I family protein [Fibrobacterales bacterium]